jgi:hypothetical protein
MNLGDIKMYALNISSLVLKSPNGTAYTITVSNAGALVVS